MNCRTEPQLAGMPLTGRITPDSLMTLEAYDRWRETHRAEVRAHRQLRSVLLGGHLTLQFESELSMRYQIQEMLRVERIFEAAGIAHEVASYAPLVPDGTNWKATLLIAYQDAEQRQQALARLIGVEDRTYVQVSGEPRVYAIADEDLDRENGHKTAAVHFLRFELTPSMRAAVRAGAPVTLGCDHAHYEAQTLIPAATLASLAQDLVSACAADSPASVV